MSKEYPTVNETIAYDEGFADAKDYWVTKEQERIIGLVKEHITYYDDFGSDVCSKCGKVFVSIENHLIALIKGKK